MMKNQSTFRLSAFNRFGCTVVVCRLVGVPPPAAHILSVLTVHIAMINLALQLLPKMQENKYKVSINAPNVDMKDIDLSLDKDGRVMNLKGQKSTKNGGMTVESQFESKILLPSDVDTDKISASISEDTLMIVAPKIDQRAALKEAKDRKVEIRVEEFDDSLQDSPSSNEQQQKADKAPEGLTNSTAI